MQSTWKLANAEKNIYKKELIRVGEFVHDTEGLKFEVTLELINHWVDVVGSYIKAGNKIPVPLGHTDDPEANRGFMLSAVREGNSLFGFIQLKSANHKQLAATADVSIYVPPKITDGLKNEYIRPIVHVALTDYPIIPGLKPFQPIAASFFSHKEPEMAEHEMIGKALGIPKEEVTEEKIIKAIKVLKETSEPLEAEGESGLESGIPAAAAAPSGDTAAIVEDAIASAEAAQVAASEAAAEVEGPGETNLALVAESAAVAAVGAAEVASAVVQVMAELTGEAPAESVAEVSGGETITASHPMMLKLAKKNREIQIDLLVKDTKLTPVAAIKLKALTMNDKALSLSLSRGGDNFDALVEILASNDPVGIGGRTGIQSLSLSDSKKSGPNALLEDAKKKREKATQKVG